MATNHTNLGEARDGLNKAITDVDNAQKTWSECVTSLHMAEIHLKNAQKNMRGAYGKLCDALNHN